MKIGFALPSYEPRKGGAERYATDLVADLAAAGEDVHVWATSLPRDEDAVPAGVQVHKLRVNPRGGRGTWRFATAAWAEQAAAGCDIVHSVGRTLFHNIYQPHGGTAPATLRANLAMLPPALRPLKWLFGDLLSMRWQVYRGIEQRALRQHRPDGAPMVIALSQRVRADLIADYRLPEDRIRVVYNGVDTKRFSPDSARSMRDYVRAKVMRVADDVPVLLMVAHNFKLKGVHHTLRALAELARQHHDVVLVICGRGRRRAFDRLAKELHVTDRVRWIGDADPIRDYYGAADIFVHPTAYDPCSLVLLEALACGLPVISTRQNGASELVTDGEQGFILEEPNAALLADRLRQLLTSDSLRERAGKSARQLALAHPRERNLKEIREVYAETLALGLHPDRPGGETRRAGV